MRNLWSIDLFQRHSPNFRKHLIAVSIGLMALAQTVTAHVVFAATDEKAMGNAVTLYSQKKYGPAADAFEALIRTSTPSARLYYYAAAANQGCNRVARAKQLSRYVITNFPASTEASYAQKLFPELSSGGAGSSSAASLSSGVPADLPAHLKSKSLEELMQTEEGRAALKEALKKQGAGTASGATSTASGSAAYGGSKTRTAKSSDRPFTAEDVAKDGAGGITDFSSGGWFECCLCAMASLPRGQKLLADMIKTRGGADTWIVSFPGNAVEYTLNQRKIETLELRDKAQWATIIHAAAALKYESDYHQSIDNGLSCLTGKPAEKLHTGATTGGAVTAFIADAIKRQQPIVCEAADSFAGLPELVESDQEYYITDFDQSTGMITIRNPHGANSRRFRLQKTDPNYQKFEQLNDGIFKMHSSIFPKYFSLLARAAI